MFINELFMKFLKLQLSLIIEIIQSFLTSTLKTNNVEITQLEFVDNQFLIERL